MEQSTNEIRRVVEKQVALRYVEYLPAGYDAVDDSKDGWPLVLFLHGAGERGNDLEKVSAIGLTKRARTGDGFPFIIVAPQCPENTWWDRMNDEIEVLLGHCVEAYKVDTSRIYLTGLSMGGFGTWHFAATHPHSFAAIAPICGGGDFQLGYPSRIRSIAHLPVWAFHGEADETVPARMSIDLVEELKAGGAPEVKLTIYPGVGHDSWTLAYDDPELYEWMLGKRNVEFAL